MTIWRIARSRPEKVLAAIIARNRRSG
jgi:hypothetical protein